MNRFSAASPLCISIIFLNNQPEKNNRQVIAGGESLIARILKMNVTTLLIVSRPGLFKMTYNLFINCDNNKQIEREGH